MAAGSASGCPTLRKPRRSEGSRRVSAPEDARTGKIRSAVHGSAQPFGEKCPNAGGNPV
ncbi:hypothetical protein Salmuc_03969 [Salipiger mucosus DSM 16094]|uniref:Uncharacterized protein n=1 Tax=Salipiger mucosus DSM 16094 TaxID=1123237 RepID=S9QFF9_9RHOB|nr:hypothetical protein Salmuc_03969 [Salipiger mucosus DSM 16094]